MTFFTKSFSPSPLSLPITSTFGHYYYPLQSPYPSSPSPLLPYHCLTLYYSRISRRYSYPYPSPHPCPYPCLRNPRSPIPYQGRSLADWMASPVVKTVKVPLCLVEGVIGGLVPARRGFGLSSIRDPGCVGLPRRKTGSVGAVTVRTKGG